jgi:NAD+ synthase
MKTKIDKISDFLKNYLENLPFKGFVIGLSGGIDSALSASLAVKAVGADKVHGIILPCTCSGERERSEDIEDGIMVANALGIDYKILKLDASAQAIIDQIRSFGGEVNKVVLANIKARLRMTAIRAYGERNRCLVLGTTNKTEEYLGYYTKAGDGGAGVDVEPIADLFKYEVFEMAKKLGNIPEKIITRVPSAGLMDGQTDEGEIGITYKEIDRYLEYRETLTDSFGIDKYKNHNDFVRISAKLKELTFEDRVIERLEHMIAINDHKRNNPPSIEL